MTCHHSGSDTVRLLSAGIPALYLYVLLVFALGTSVAGVALRVPQVIALFVLGVAAWHFALRERLERLTSPALVLNFSLLSVVLLMLGVGLDLGASALLNLRAPAFDIAALPQNDKNGWAGEWYPPLYYPDERNFRLHKPGFDITGDHYGRYYLPAMLRSPTLVDSVLIRHHMSIHINELGFRETSPLGACGIFSLGDSFTFGWGVTDGATWEDLLERRLGTCVYNLGIMDASPKQELLLLEDFLRRPGAPTVKRLIWMVYEGNDLEDSFADWNPTLARAGRWQRMKRGTILDLAGELLNRIHTESLAQRLRTGEVSFASPSRRRRDARLYTVDGVQLFTPLFRSPRLGYLLVERQLLNLAAEPEPHTLEHPNRAALEKVFARMGHLSDSLRFSVTVAIMPTAPRTHASAFPLSPAPTTEPYLVNYFERLARSNGFDVVNLLHAFQPYAKTELLYFTDDDHLNGRGSEVVAQVLAEHLGPDCRGC
jgi:lysophospholipase L1-like esterase